MALVTDETTVAKEWTEAHLIGAMLAQLCEEESLAIRRVQANQ